MVLMASGPEELWVYTDQSSRLNGGRVICFCSHILENSIKALDATENFVYHKVVESLVAQVVALVVFAPVGHNVKEGQLVTSNWVIVPCWQAV